MDFIGLVTMVSVIGSVAGVLLVHRFVGFRQDNSEAGPSELRAGATEGDLADQINHLQATTRRLCEQIVEMELSDEARWRTLDESQEEVRELRAKVFELHLELKRRFRDSNESRRRRERELERHRERELGRHRERELLESGRSGQKERPLAAAR